MTELGLISEEQLATVLEVQQQSKRPLGQIIVELGFASGAAVAHALAMQSGGALKTEYGFALGAPPVDEEATADETGASLPKLRLASTAVAPARTSGAPEEGGPADDAVESATVEEQSELVAVPGEPDEVAAEAHGAVEVEEAEALEAAPEEVEETPDAELEEVPAEIDESAETPLAVETDSEELFEAALAETPIANEQKLDESQEEHDRAAAELELLPASTADRDRLAADVERLEAALAETQTAHEQKLAELREEHERATTEIERLQTIVAGTGSEHDQELRRLQEERDEVATELERLRAGLAEAQASAAEHARRLSEEQERHAGERDELTSQRDEIMAQRDRMQDELGDAFERLAAAGPTAEERDGLRAELEQLGSTLAETQAAADAERERLSSDVERLESTLSETLTAQEEELGRLREGRDRAREEIESLQNALTEVQASAGEQERRMAEEQERHVGERDELTAQRERLQEELRDAVERLALAAPAAQERDELRTEVERLQHVLAEVRESAAAELGGVVGERDRLAAELEDARELLRQAERVRESQIALEAERDSALAEIERLQTVAAEAETEAEERARLLAEEQDRHHSERETLLAQRTVLEEELGRSIEQLAEAAAAADQREAQLQVDSERLLEALDAIRSLATELATGSEELPPEPSTDEPEAEPEAASEESAPEAATDEPDAGAEVIEYSLFVPGPNGYELVPQTGVPPQAGQRVELVLSESEEPTLYEVVRSGRPLPDGDVCVYLAQV